jgi:hypothetical protein
MVEGHTVCYHSESAVSDDLGRYVLPAWRNANPTAEERRLRFEDLSIVVYKRGFAWIPSSSVEKKAGTVFARRLTGSLEERVDNMRVWPPCNAVDGSDRNLLPLFRELLLTAIAYREETGNDAPAMLIRGEMELIGGDPAAIDKNAPRGQPQ